MEIIPFQSNLLPQAAALFTRRFHTLRAQIPALPDRMADEACLVELLTGLLRSCPGLTDQSCPGLVAIEGGRLLGYMGWYLIPRFRGTDHKAALTVEWAHGAVEEDRQKVYQALYNVAAARWFEAGCETHAVSMLAGDAIEERLWFWNGFGLTVVDAVRPIQPLGLARQIPFEVRPAGTNDLKKLAEIEAEHARHYPQPPTLMVSSHPDGVEEYREFFKQPENSVWLALAGQEIAGYFRTECASNGAAEIVSDPDTIAITGAYTRPRYRGHGIAPALLDAVLTEYQGRGYRRCSVDFESLNPTAAAFWVRYFEPVVLSVIRNPERRPVEPR